MNNCKNVYVVSPAHVATGGTEATHTLCLELLKIGMRAFMFYVNSRIPGEEVPFRFKNLNLPYVVRLSDVADAIMVIPETNTDLINRFPLMKKFVWWLSVDNYTRPFKLCGPRDMYYLLKDRITKRNVDFTDDSIGHLCQSCYAMNFLGRHGVKNASYLMDYLSEEHLSVVKGDENTRENVILYNPAKGIAFTRKIMNAAPKWCKFIPLQNMTPEEVHSWCSRAKVYIDFGNHPGKDRFPREAAMAGCVVITSRRGSAAFHEDLPIDDSYKFHDSKSNIPRIIDLISDCLRNYERHFDKFRQYRDFIRGDYIRFVDQVRNVFCPRSDKISVDLSCCEP